MAPKKRKARDSMLAIEHKAKKAKKARDKERNEEAYNKYMSEKDTKSQLANDLDQKLRELNKVALTTPLPDGGFNAMTWEQRAERICWTATEKKEFNTALTLEAWGLWKPNNRPYPYEDMPGTVVNENDWCRYCGSRVSPKGFPIVAEGKEAGRFKNLPLCYSHWALHQKHIKGQPGLDLKARNVEMRLPGWRHDQWDRDCVPRRDHNTEVAYIRKVIKKAQTGGSSITGSGSSTGTSSSGIVSCVG
jgi:hypothetical protein